MASDFRLKNLRFFLYNGQQVVEEKTVLDTPSPNNPNVSTKTYVWGRYIDELCTMDTQSLNNGITESRLFFHCNANYSIYAATNENGAVVERVQYDVFGRPDFQNPSGKSLDQEESIIENPYLFQGRRWDGESKLYYYRNRYYDPGKGRFISRDPMGIWGDTMQYGNGYSSFSLDPESNSDPYGKQSKGPMPIGPHGEGGTTFDCCPELGWPDHRDTEQVCAACIIYAESRGENDTCRMAVYGVLVNRVNSSNFPDSICEVVKQKNQFAGYDNHNYKECLDQADECPWEHPGLDTELGEAWKTDASFPAGGDPANGAQWFESKHPGKPDFHRKKVKEGIIEEVDVPGCPDKSFEFYKRK